MTNQPLQAYDTTGEGYISSHRLREVFSYLGFGELSSDEMIVLSKVILLVFSLVISTTNKCIHKLTKE